MAPSAEWGKYPSLRVSLVQRPHYSPLKICFVIRHGVSVKTGSMIDFKEGRRGPDMSSPKGGSLHFTPSHTPANISSGQQVLRVPFLLNLPQATFAWERKKTHRFTTLSRCPPPCWFEAPSHSSLYIGDAQTRQVKNAEIMQSPLIDLCCCCLNVCISFLQKSDFFQAVILLKYALSFSTVPSLMTLHISRQPRVKVQKFQSCFLFSSWY